jgi:hypothetical protein
VPVRWEDAILLATEVEENAKNERAIRRIINARSRRQRLYERPAGV